jgi:hypothetical protein
MRKGALPGFRVLVDSVDERAVDVENHRLNHERSAAIQDE